MSLKAKIRIDPRDMARMKARFRKAVNHSLDKAVPLMRTLLKEIKQESQEIVPLRSGNLQSAAHYSVRRNPVSVTGQFWYDTDKAPYALVQHETPDPPWSHLPGRRWHYWSDPVDAREQDIEDIWRKCFEGVWG